MPCPRPTTLGHSPFPSGAGVWAWTLRPPGHAPTGQLPSVTPICPAPASAGKPHKRLLSMLEQVEESPRQQSRRRGAGKPCQLCSCHRRRRELAEAGSAPPNPPPHTPQGTARPARRSVRPPSAPLGWLEGAGSGSEWRPSVRGTSWPLRPKPTEPWLNSTTWWTCRRPQSQASFFVVSVLRFLPLFPARLCDYQNPLPFNRILLRYGSLSEGPTQALQTRQENKSPKERASG